jgi:hypothetical protein
VIRSRLVILLAVVTVGPLALASPAPAAPAGPARSPVLASGGYDGRGALREMGYVSARSPLHVQAKAEAARRAALLNPAAQPTAPQAPTIGASWQGVKDGTLSPPDTNGAIGPNSYVEIINLQAGLYDRTGAIIATANLQTLTGHSQFNLSDPMILWDPHTQRFYYNVWDTTQATMAFGFSKSANPANLTSDWCKYTGSFGYSTSNAPDYPKLGQTRQFLLIGVNFYPSFSSLSSTQSDLLWVSKPQGSGPIASCPSATTFKAGKFSDIRNVDGTQAFTPVPAIQADSSKAGFVVASADIETGGTGNFLTVFQVTPSGADPTVPALSAPHAISVPAYQMGPDAPQANTNRLLDTLDGRLTHSVQAKDPRAQTTTVWTGHAVLGGAGTEFRWYEIKPLPLTTPTLFQSGDITNPDLFVFNGAVSSDRTVNPGGAAHGANMMGGFDTSSTTTFSTIQMVSKIGANAQSAFKLVKASPGKNEDFTCTSAGSTCRWGDYGGATPDPGADLAARRGSVWFTNEWNATSTNPFGVFWRTWNWQGFP